MFTFNDCIDNAQIKSKYRRLAFQTHPDMHIQTEFAKWNEAMQVLNAVYLDALQHCDGMVTTGTDGRDHTYHYNPTTEETLIDAVARAIRAKLPDRATVSIVGIYIWVEGLARDDVEYHKALSGTPNPDGTQPDDRFYFHGKRKCWYWKPKKYKARYNHHATLDDLKGYYGSRTVEREEQTALAI